jgi:hypothetical protein
MSEGQPGPPEPQPPDRSQDQQVFYGIGLGFGLHLLQIPLVVLLGVLVAGGDSGAVVVVGMFSLILIGVTQLLYIGPALVVAGMRGKRGLVQGMLIAAAATFALNAACWGLVVGMGQF